MLLSGGRIENGYITVYLSLTLAVLLSLCLSLIEGARSSAIALETEVVSSIGMNSIMAEYNRELMKQFNLYAIDTTYGGEAAGIANTLDHLQNYLEKNVSMDDVFLADYLYRDFLKMSVGEVSIPEVRFMTDEDEKVFRKRCAEAVYDDIGLSISEEVWDWIRSLSGAGVFDLNVENLIAEQEAELAREQKQIAAEKLPQKIEAEKEHKKQEYINRGEDVPDVIEVDVKTPSFYNPVPTIGEGRGGKVLNYAVKIPISQRQISLEQLFSHRKVEQGKNQGNMGLEEDFFLAGMAEKLVFVEYLFRYMGCWLSEGQDDALKYQLEYILVGEGSDIDNISGVANRLLLLRAALDYLYILTDAAKGETAKALAVIVSVILWCEELVEPITQLILMSWALAEAMQDVKVLLNNGEIPLWKSAGSWMTDLDDLLLGKVEEPSGSEGLTYQQYLRIMLLLSGEDTLSSRAIDMIEADVRLAGGSSSFRMDGCIDSLKARIRMDSDYGYSYSVSEKRRYE